MQTCYCLNTHSKERSVKIKHCIVPFGQLTDATIAIGNFGKFEWQLNKNPEFVNKL